MPVRVRSLSLTVVASLVAALLALTSHPAAAATDAALFVSEINADNGSHTVAGTTSLQDNFEFFEIANTTAAPIDLAAGYSITYNGSVALTVAADSPSPAVIPARGALTFWLRYKAGAADGFSSGSPNAYLFTADEFRAHYGMGDTAPVVYIEGQGGMANGGGRSIEVRRSGAIISRSTYAAGQVGQDLSANFAAPPAGTTEAPIFAAAATPTPGTVQAAQLSDPPAPPGPSVPPQGPPPPTDPTLTAPMLQITEVAPDTRNVNGADGFEFVEVYNASDAPIDFADYTINYLYIGANAVTTNSTLWPAEPASAVIDPGHTLVLWIKNGGNQALTAADFNKEFGANLVLGKSLLEIQSGGMANGGLRGIQVMTNTGYDISRAYYFNDAQTTATTAIQYAWNPAPSAEHQWTPSNPAGTAQTLLGIATPTPGYAAPTQVPTGLVATPMDSAAPTIIDLSASSDVPDSDRLELLFEVSDDVQVRTVTLTLDTNVTEPATRFLRFESLNRYAYGIPNADLYGKRWLEYTVTASDGVHETTYGPVRINLVDGEPDPVRLNLTDGQFVGGQTRVAATADTDAAALTLSIDGAAVASTTPSLEAAPKFVIEATSTDAFFRNGIKIGDDVLTIFDQGFYDRIETVAADVPVDRVVRGEPLTIGVYAGTKAWPQPDLNENNDDFAAMDPRLSLPDGRVLLPVSCAKAGEAAGQEYAPVACPGPGDRIGFNDANLVYFTATFDIPADAFDSVAYLWDTTTVADGPHTITATTPAASAQRTVTVDNTAPTITPAISNGAHLRGEFTIDARIADGGSGVTASNATLDGAAIAVPHATSSTTLAPGQHTLEITAVDRVGNQATVTVTFTTADEQPRIALGQPAEDATVAAGDVVLAASASTPENDPLTLTFLEGHSYQPTDAQMTVAAGAATSLGDLADAAPVAAGDLPKLVGDDDVTVPVSSDTKLPYQLFTVDVPADAGQGAKVRVAWDGTANADAKVLMYVAAADNTWTEVDRYVTTGGAPTSFTLDAVVPVEGNVVDGKVRVLVQHSEGFAGDAGSTRADTVTPYHPEATPRGQYDFTIGWMSDTQYYNETQAFYPHQLNMNQFLLDQRDELNLQYVIHTGDIVDDWDQMYQWDNADAAYRLFDDAGLPYGVLAGNHDVGHHSNDYSNYGQFFGADRFDANPWYGGSHLDNRGHYDLISANGVDLLLLYMGWGPGDEQIEWMNEVIARYPERKVWINLHEYMLTTGGLGPIPQRIYDEVVAPNPNVFAVSSGHYHDAYTRTDGFDDTGDGVADRTVYSMLFDYQGLPEGGLGYLRLLHFDNVGGRIIVRTYSPSLGVFESDNAALNNPPGMQTFEIPYAAVGIVPATKTLATDWFRADVLTAKQIGVVSGVPSGTTATVTWPAVQPGVHGWYVNAVGPYGGTADSEVRTFTAAYTEAVPTRVEAKVTGKTVQVSWKEAVGATGPIEGYVVRVLVDGVAVGEPITAGVKPNHVKLADLVPGATYTFTVQAFTANGFSAEVATAALRFCPAGDRRACAAG